MKPKEQRIAIAEFCGHKDINNRIYVIVNDVIVWRVPNYLNDLNAMHEAEEVLGGPSDYKWAGYCNFLSDVCGEMGSRIHASAEQRAEALLKTIGKWKD